MMNVRTLFIDSTGTDYNNRIISILNKAVELLLNKAVELCRV